MSYDRIVISSGHGKYVRGASGVIDEVNEARRLVEHLADELRLRDVDVTTYHDDVAWMKFRSGTRDYPVAQPEDTTFTLVVA